MEVQMDNVGRESGEELGAERVVVWLFVLHEEVKRAEGGRSAEEGDESVGVAVWVEVVADDGEGCEGGEIREWAAVGEASVGRSWEKRGIERGGRCWC
jgi:hypothetical protein